MNKTVACIHLDRKRSERSTAGLTLLETLVALTILAGATASVMTLVATNRRAQADAEADLSSALHARSLLARLGRDLPLEIGILSGTFDDGQAWSVRVTPFAPDAGGARGAVLLHVQVRLQDKLRRPLLEVSTLRRTTP